MSHVRIHLRPVHEHEIPILYEHQADVIACEMALVKPRTETQFRELMVRTLADPTCIFRVIVLDELVVGSIVCFQRDDQDTIGYSIGRTYWGQGIATWALALFLGEVTTRPLYAQAARTNVGSIRVLEKCGFRQIGYAWCTESDRYFACQEALFELKTNTEPGRR